MQNNQFKIEIRDQTFYMLAQKCLYYPEENILFISDTHFGKTSHFKKYGLYVPDVMHADLKRLETALQQTQAKRLIILGDLFHSLYNNEWEIWIAFIKKHPDISFELVYGNHDILPENDYLRSSMLLHGNVLVINKFTFRHALPKKIPTDTYTIAGHLHPAVGISHLRKTEKYPCFYKTQHYLLLPAFGTFTGTALVKRGKDADIFIPSENEVVALKQ